MLKGQGEPGVNYRGRLRNGCDARSVTKFFVATIQVNLS